VAGNALPGGRFNTRAPQRVCKKCVDDLLTQRLSPSDEISIHQLRTFRNAKAQNMVVAAHPIHLSILEDDQARARSDSRGNSLHPRRSSGPLSGTGGLGSSTRLSESKTGTAGSDTEGEARRNSWEEAANTLEKRDALSLFERGEGGESRLGWWGDRDSVDFFGLKAIVTGVDGKKEKESGKEEGSPKGSEASRR